tara:strand:+ start:1579 stop:1815 length:237 start_codon:yes stop_codon:yes gene_type:complete
MNKFLYIVDHFVPFPQSEYGGVWNVIAKDDEECFDIIVVDDDELHFGYYTKLRENIKKSYKYMIVDDEKSRVVSSFIT